MWLGRSAVARAGDDFTDLDHTWATESTARGLPILLLQPDLYVGLLPK
ncbi:hypothetical protein ACIPW5_25565 [Streptomyces sp. NPDC090077]